MEDGTHALTHLPVGYLRDRADEGSAEELDDRERTADARGREDEARVLAQVRPRHRRRWLWNGPPEHG